MSQGPSIRKGSNGLADIGTVRFDEPGFPSGQRLTTGLDPGKHLFNLFSVGENELQAPEIEFLKNSHLVLGCLAIDSQTYKIFLGLVP